MFQDVEHIASLDVEHHLLEPDAPLLLELRVLRVVPVEVLRGPCPIPPRVPANVTLTPQAGQRSADAGRVVPQQNAGRLGEAASEEADAARTPDLSSRLDISINDSVS
jgi:hypothetical protein